MKKILTLLLLITGYFAEAQTPRPYRFTCLSTQVQLTDTGYHTSQLFSKGSVVVNRTASTLVLQTPGASFTWTASAQVNQNTIGALRAPTLDSGFTLIANCINQNNNPCAIIGPTGPTGATGGDGPTGPTGAAGVATPDTLNIASGRYLPDTASTVNARNLQIFFASWTQIDSIVTVYGGFGASTRALSSQGEIRFRLPVPAGRYPALILNGLLTCSNGNISGAGLQAVGNTIQMQWYPTDTGPYLYKYSYSYITDSPRVGKIVQGGIVGATGPTGPAGGNGYWTQTADSLYNTALAKNVGIGTASPQTTFHVNGSTLFNSVGVSLKLDSVFTMFWPPYIRDIVIPGGGLFDSKLLIQLSDTVTKINTTLRMKPGQFGVNTDFPSGSAMSIDGSSTDDGGGQMSAQKVFRYTRADGTTFQSGVYCTNVNDPTNGQTEIAIYVPGLGDVCSFQSYKYYHSPFFKIIMYDTVTGTYNNVVIQNLNKNVRYTNMASLTDTVSMFRAYQLIDSGLIMRGSLIVPRNAAADEVLTSDANGVLSLKAPVASGGTGSVPASPTLGQFYFDADLTKMKFWNGTVWAVVTSIP